MTLRTKLVSALVSLGLVMGLMVAVNFVIFERLYNRLTDMLTVHVKLIHVTSELETLIYRMSRAEKRFMNVGDPTTLGRLEERKADVERALSRLVPLMKTPKGQQSLKDLRDSYGEYEKLLDREQKLYVQGNQAAVRKMSYGVVWQQINDMNKILDDIANEAIETTKVIQRENAGFFARFRAGMWIIIAVGLILIAGVGIVLIQVERGIRHVSEGMVLVAQKKFDYELPLTGRNDELGQMENIFNTMVVQIRQLTKRLHEEATTDPLTQLKNRRSFQARLEEEMYRAKRYHRPMAIAILDLDGFKQYNDTCGHLEGDEILKTMGTILTTHVRDIDEVGRYGGEEFVVLFPETDGEEAGVILERIRHEVERAFKVKQPPLTISGGVATGPASFEKAEAMLKAADQALYEAKRSGKNQIRRAS